MARRRPKPQTLPKVFQPGFIEAMDQRTDLAKQLRAAYEAVVEDIGGDPSFVQVTLIERFVWADRFCREIEMRVQDGDVKLMPQWTTMVNSLTGLGKLIGIRRVKVENRIDAIYKLVEGDDDEDAA